MSKKCADTQTHTQDDYCNPPPTLGLIMTYLCIINNFCIDNILSFILFYYSVVLLNVFLIQSRETS